MSDFFEESSDDEINIKLHLAERLRINRSEHSFSDRKSESSKDLKHFHNMRRKKLSKDNQSSSSSSLEIQSDAGVSGASSAYMLPNKKRQNGDKILEQFTNPKRTCLSDRFRKNSEWRESKKKNYNNGAHCGCTKASDSSFPYSENSAGKDLYPDNTYEDHLNNLADAEDSDLDFSPQTSRNFQKGIAQNSKLLKSNYQQSSSTKHGADSECRENSAAANRILYVDSGSDDDSKISVQNGALKGGRQSPDLIFFNKKVLGKKVKKVLDSDDTDEDDWQIGYRNRPLVFTTSSDSEDSRNPSKSTLGGTSNEAANHSFSYRDAYKHKDLHASVNFRSSSSSHFKPPQASRSPCPSTSSMKQQNNIGDDCNSQFLLPAATHDFQSSVSVSKPYRARKSNRVNVPLTTVSTKLPDSFTTNRSSPGLPRRGRSRMGGNERRVIRSGSPHPRTMHGQNRAENSKLLRDRSRSVNAAYSQNERSLADVYPDLFDAEDSSEVEFFTANSYSDTETSTESLGGLTINATIVGTSDALSNAEIVCERNVGSSEDEISVVFATASHSRNDQRRGTSRAIGRRYGRGRDGRHLQRREAVSLSPDPVEQVRQVEEDERFARMLQAQFDAEVDSDYSPRVRQGPHSNTSVESDDDIIDPIEVNDSDSEGMFSSLFPFVHVSTARSRGRVRRISSRPGTPNNFPQALFFHNRRRENIPNRRRYGGTDHRWQFARLLGLSPTLISFENTEDDYEAFLGLAELNGEVMPRGLQRAQINRLPTRKYIIPNGASSSCQSSEITHKRTELNKECQVCLSDYESGDVLRILPCFHEFHTPCIDPWLKINHTCPVCRVIVDLEE